MIKNLELFAKIYIAIALIVSAIYSSPALSFIPILILAWYLYQWRWPFSAMVDLLTKHFVFFALPLLGSVFIPGLLAPLVGLPVLLTTVQSLKRTASTIEFRRTNKKRIPTSLSIVLFSIALVTLLVGLVVSSPALTLSSGIYLLCFVGMVVFLIRRFPVKPVSEEIVHLRVIAGKARDVKIKLETRTRLGGLLFAESSQDWIKVQSRILSLKEDRAFLHISVAPTLSGSSMVKLNGYAIDCWGMLQTAFEIEPVKLTIIPRARYASLLAHKYIAGTKPGVLPLVSNVGAIKSLQGLRRGIEYYGNRPYQPGDSLKNIDWKHTSKYHELISKEFTEFSGQPAVILINRVSGDAEESDKLAYNILATAISLGQDNIPGALAVYDQEKVVLTTGILSSAHLVGASLRVVKDLVIMKNPLRYLNPPDVNRLRANIRRIEQSGSQSAKRLAELLRLEYEVLSKSAIVNPCTLALTQVMAKVSGQACVVVLSQRNHDAEALAFNLFNLSRSGKSVVLV
jgi:hypothetical protein